ncbi:MAG TPA: hypothetical protein VJX66_20015 [Amycolatopsis sp.]|nr:hypothetical protein [Amycolatopsis sp.]
MPERKPPSSPAILLTNQEANARVDVTETELTARGDEEALDVRRAAVCRVERRR